MEIEVLIKAYYTEYLAYGIGRYFLYRKEDGVLAWENISWQLSDSYEKSIERMKINFPDIVGLPILKKQLMVTKWGTEDLTLENFPLEFE